MNSIIDKIFRQHEIVFRQLQSQSDHLIDNLRSKDKNKQVTQLELLRKTEFSIYPRLMNQKS